MGILRRYDGFLAALVLVGLGLTLWLLRSGDVVAGPARVIDGDTLAIAGRTIRLAGLDAPEMAQLCGAASTARRCGDAAREALRALVGSAVPECRVTGRDRYGRDLARCAVGGEDLGARLVADGYAVAYGAYEREEAAARAAAQGLWAAPFERPSDWRRRHARPAEDAASERSQARAIPD